jgi:hypothetical protein
VDVDANVATGANAGQQSWLDGLLGLFVDVN